MHAIRYVVHLVYLALAALVLLVAIANGSTWAGIGFAIFIMMRRGAVEATVRGYQRPGLFFWCYAPSALAFLIAGATDSWAWLAMVAVALLSAYIWSYGFRDLATSLSLGNEDAESPKRH